MVYVIDTGKVKEIQYDANSGLCRLVETWTTKAAAKQRRGRAGRTKPGASRSDHSEYDSRPLGTCYKLYSKKRHENMAAFPTPEILRMPLENILLSIKSTREDQDVKVMQLILTNLVLNHLGLSRKRY